MKLYLIEHITYSDTCGDDFYGKERRSYALYYVNDTKENVDKLLEKLNWKNKSYYHREPTDEELEFNIRDWEDEDYITATEVEISSISDIINKEFNINKAV